MTHPILEPLIIQLPHTAFSRKLIEENKEYKDILLQLAKERKWCRRPQSLHDENRTGCWYLEQNGYEEWLKDAADEDFVRTVGVLQLILETCSALEEDVDEDDHSY